MTISCETTGATIYYTTNGDAPTNLSTQYTSAITVSETTTIKAIAYVGNDASSVATATYTIVNFEHAGTEADPYSVADARTAIDANIGVTGVYATGIVSQIVTPYGDNGYSNITFNFVDNEGDTDFLQAFRCVSSDGADASTVAVGDVVVVYGNLTKYNTTYEFGQGCQLVSIEHAAVAVEAPTFSPEAGTYASAQSVTIACATDGASIHYTTDGTEPTSASTQYTAAISVTTTTTIKAIAIKGSDESTIATATYHINSQTNPYTVAQALAFNEYPANGIYVHGIVSTAPTQNPTSNGELTYYISDNGEATNQLEVYKGKGLEQAAFTAQDDIQVGDIVTVYGNVVIFNGTKEFTTGNYLVSFERPLVPEIEATAGEALAYNATEGSIVYEISNYVEGTMAATTSADWISNLVVDEQDEMGEVTFNVTTNNTGEVRTGTITLTFTYDTDKTVTADVTVSQAALVVPVINAEDLNIAFTATSGSIAYTIDNPIEGTNLTASVPTGSWLTLGEITATEVPFTCSTNEGEARTETVTLTYGDITKDVTVTQAAYAEIYIGEGTFNKVTSLADLEDGGYYVLAYNDYAMTNVVNSDNYMVGSNEFTVANNAIIDPAQGIVWKLEADGENWKLYNEAEEKYCYISGTNAKSFHMAGTSEYSFIVTMNDNSEFLFKTTHSSARCIANYQGTTFRAYAASNNPTPAVYLYKLGEASQDPYFTADNVEIDYDDESGSITYTVNNPVEGGIVTAEVTDGEWLTLGSGTTSPISFTCSANADYTSREATVTLTYTYNNSKPAVTATVTITQGAAPYPTTTYTLATSIVSGKHYIITNGSNKAMGAQGSNNRPAVGVEIEEGVATVRSADVYEFVINGPDADGFYTIYDKEYENNNSIGGYLYAASSSSSSYLRTRNHMESDSKDIWDIVFSETPEEGVVITSQGIDTRNIIRYNSGSGLFNCYSSGQQPIFLYMKDDDTNYEFYKDIAAYQGDGGYYLIASPVNNVNPANVAGMTTGDFDLYYFDNSQDLEWINYEADDQGNINSDFGNLMSGRGYLYANSESVTLAFTGTPYSGNGQVPVVAGYNLVGNPFSVAATPNQPYYRLNGEGGEVNADTESSAVNAMEGVFVNAAEAGNVTFSTGTSKGQNIALNVMKNRGTTIDRAIVRFDKGQQLPKFQLFENSTKLYVPQGNQDFAVVRSAAEAEMPVSFKASENGTYTLAIEAENVEMNYLHLIDNMTGMDVDLLQTPSYTFEAKTSDYASRFRLVFKANANEENAETFAYFNGSNWTVSNLGEATLQVVDVTGRTLSSETINGNATISLNQTPGVYMLRLVNGNSVKVQKVVVR